MKPIEYPPIKPYSAYPDDEADYLAQSILSIVARSEIRGTRPASLSRHDAENHINAVLQKGCIPPITLPPQPEPTTTTQPPSRP